MLSRDDRVLLTKVQEIKSAAGVGDRYSDLRVFDIVVWMATSGRTPR